MPVPIPAAISSFWVWQSCCCFNLQIERKVKKLFKEIENLKNEIKRCQNMLNNPSFVAKAPVEKVSLEREKLQKHLDNLKVLEEKLQNL